MGNEVEITKVEARQGELFITGESFDRGKLITTIRKVAKEYTEDPGNNLTAWASAGVEKAGTPEAFDPQHPDMDSRKRLKLADERKETVKWRYRQTVKMTRNL